MTTMSPQEVLQLKTNLTDLHRMLGTYEEYLRATGFVVADSGNAEEAAAIKTLCEGIEKRVARMP